MPKKIIVGTMAETREASENLDKWEKFKFDYQSNNIQCFETSFLDSQDSTNEIFMSLIRELSSDQNVLNYENAL